MKHAAAVKIHTFDQIHYFNEFLNEIDDIINQLSLPLIAHIYYISNFTDKVCR